KRPVKPMLCAIYARIYEIIGLEGKNIIPSHQLRFSKTPAASFPRRRESNLTLRNSNLNSPLFSISLFGQSFAYEQNVVSFAVYVMVSVTHCPVTVSRLPSSFSTLWVGTQT
ncbi:MAG: hypothetical protein L0H70_05520, partial [Xanthomonadales bacterium]|nr:hypothetical protein [Xanthomonadales bacterium]